MAVNLLRKVTEMDNIKPVLRPRFLIVLALGTLPLMIAFTNCSKVDLETAKGLNSAAAGMQGVLCYPYNAQDYTRYELSDFYLININALPVNGELSSDSNANGIADHLEQNLSEVPNTVRVSSLDTDEDGLPDFLEDLKGLDKTRSDADIDGIDNDGVINKRELQLGIDPHFPDQSSARTRFFVNYLGPENSPTGCGENQPAYSFNVQAIPTINTTSFIDTVNSNSKLSLSHEQNENVFMVLARMSPLNSNFEPLFLAYIFKQSIFDPLVWDITPSHFFKLSLPSGGDCQDCSGNLTLPDRLAKVGTGSRHTCTSSLNGDVFCWGSNSYGELGSGNFSSVTGVSPVSIPEPAKSVSTGESHSCAITASDDLYCWGRNFYGQIGDGSTNDAPSPIKIELADKVDSVTLGRHHSCAVLQNQSIWCWGRNHMGQLGQGNTSSYVAAPQLITTTSLSFPLKDFQSGNHQTCAVDSSYRAFCWGGFQSCTESSPTHVLASACSQLSHLSSYSSLRFNKFATSGGLHYGIASSNQQGVCWSQSAPNDPVNHTRGCGVLDENQPSNIYTQLISNLTQVAVGEGQSCAIHQAGSTTLSCWGAGLTSPSEPDPIPRSMSQVQNPSELSMGYKHACSIDGHGKLWCWGENAYYQLGQSHNQDSTDPLQVN